MRAGADIIDLGVPFSDPVADGPTIQRASQVALGHGVDMAWTLATLQRFRARHDTPVVLFSYLNPVLAYGTERFLADAADAGADGVLLTDLPAGADDQLESLFEASGLALIRLVAPTTPASRLDDIAQRAQGFIYYVARLGVTGAGADLRDELAAELDRMRVRTRVPVAVGFGVSTADHAARLAPHADGVIVGSALIDALDRGGVAAAGELLAAMSGVLGPRA